MGDEAGASPTAASGELQGFPPLGVLAPMLTPFDPDMSVSTERYAAHARRLLDSGCVGLVPFGTTGEALSVGMRERMDAVEALVASGVDPGALVVGTGLSNLPGTAHLTAHAVDLGCQAVMVLPPFYFKDPPAEGLFRHFAALVDRVDDDRLRIILYHIPQVSGVGVPVEVAARLRREFPEVVVGIKDSSGDWENTRLLFEVDGLAVWPGAELPLMEALDLGGPGCITATANLNAGPIAEVVRLHAAGDREAAASRMAGVAAYRLALQGYAAIPTLKRLLALRLDDPGWAVVRPPFLPMDEAAGRELAERLAGL